MSCTSTSSALSGVSPSMRRTATCSDALAPCAAGARRPSCRARAPSSAARSGTRRWRSAWRRSDRHKPDRVQALVRGQALEEGGDARRRARLDQLLERLLHRVGDEVASGCRGRARTSAWSACRRAAPPRRRTTPARQQRHEEAERQSHEGERRLCSRSWLALSYSRPGCVHAASARRGVRLVLHCAPLKTATWPTSDCGTCGPARA